MSLDIREPLGLKFYQFDDEIIDFAYGWKGVVTEADVFEARVTRPSAIHDAEQDVFLARICPGLLEHPRIARHVREAAIFRREPNFSPKVGSWATFELEFVFSQKKLSREPELNVREYNTQLRKPEVFPNLIRDLEVYSQEQPLRVNQQVLIESVTCFLKRQVEEIGTEREAILRRGAGSNYWL
jgi:hypothetical protein